VGKYDKDYFAADLEALLRMARIKLPDMADVYLTANHHVSDTGDRDASAFTMTSRVYPAWRDLRDEFQRILGKTADNIGGVARALEMVVGHYADADDEAAAILEESVRDSGPKMRSPRYDKLSAPEMPKE